MNADWDQVKVQSEDWTPEQILRWTFATFGKDVALASAFGAEGMVLIDMASRIRPGFRVFTVDTEFLFPETYDLMDRVQKRYRVKLERVLPALTPEAQETAYGPALWSRDPDQCCKLRKIEPLKGKLAELRAWITALRRDQTASRARAGKVEWDAQFQRVKINPIADWTAEMVRHYIARHKVPYNSLHDQGYPSIGCTHCTRAVRAGEDPRSGRWAGFQKTECGLHVELSPSTVQLVRISGPEECDEG